MINAERIIFIDHLPRNSKWDGGVVLRKKECDGCEYRYVVLEKSPDGANVHKYDICAWGVAWKVLTEKMANLSCANLSKDRPFDYCFRFRRPETAFWYQKEFDLNESK